MTALPTVAFARGPLRPRAVTRIRGALLVAMVVANVAYLVGLLIPGAGADPLVDVWIATAVQWIPVAIFWLVAASTRFRSLPVILASLGVTAWSAGDSYFTFAMDEAGRLQFPSPADALYLLFYPLMFAALVALVRRRLRGAGALVLLETAVATVGASAVLAVVLDPVIRLAPADATLASAVALAYPLFGIVLLAVIAGIVSAPIAVGRRWWALATGLAVSGAGDVVYALLESQGMYVAGTPLDATWAAGTAFATWWVAGVPGSGAAAPSRPARRAIPIPALVVVAALVVLVVGTQVPVSPLAVGLAAATVGLGAVPIIFRQAMLGRMLAAQEEAVRRLLEIDRAKTDLVVSMNHEFRTPLTSITGHVDLLLDEDLPPQASGMLRTIERNGARLQRLIDATLTSSRLEAGELPLVLAPVDIGEVLDRAVASVESVALARGTRVDVENRVGPMVVAADAPHLEHALADLLDNAIKFGPRDAVVRVTVERVTRGGVAVRIRDDGIGIPEGERAEVFDRFARASNARTAAIPGVGLGLSIARDVVRAHGGDIHLTSVEGRGTEAVVRLPRPGSAPAALRRWLASR